MSCRAEVEAIGEDRVNVSFPKPRGFRMALQRVVNREHIAWRDGGTLEGLCPPLTILVVHQHKEGLNRRRSLCKGITSISTKGNQIQSSGHSPKQATIRLFHTCGIRFCKGDGTAVAFAAIAGCACFVNDLTCEWVDLEKVRPHKGEDYGTRGTGNRVAEHPLCLVFVVLEPFGCAPFTMVTAFLELGTDKCDGVMLDTKPDCVNGVIKLVECKLRDIGVGV